MELHAERSLRIFTDAAGRIVLDGRFDPATGAPIVAAIEGIVTTQLRASRGANGGAVASHGEGAADGAVAEDTRSLAQMRADALSAICRHATGCDAAELPREAMIAVVRMDLDDLQEGIGVATIDGIEQPVDASTARQMAASAAMIPCVLGGGSQVLDLGRRKRHFSSGQRLVLVERDGGCAFCHLPPGYTEAHHILWWKRDRGPTDIRNGILLCTACHHRVHDESWEIRIESPPGAEAGGADDTVWFLPPTHIDPARTPRLGGRKRFDPLRWKLAA